jgi:hypothetical protein
MQGTLFWHVQDGHAKEIKKHVQVHILLKCCYEITI